MFDFSRLKGRITEKYGTQQRFAEALGATPTTVGYKLDGKRTWNQDEIISSCDLLEISYNDIPDYFFVKKVALSQLDE